MGNSSAKQPANFLRGLASVFRLASVWQSLGRGGAGDDLRQKLDVLNHAFANGFSCQDYNDFKSAKPLVLIVMQKAEKKMKSDFMQPDHRGREEKCKKQAVERMSNYLLALGADVQVRFLESNVPARRGLIGLEIKRALPDFVHRPVSVVAIGDVGIPAYEAAYDNSRNVQCFVGINAPIQDAYIGGKKSTDVAVVSLFDRKNASFEHEDRCQPRRGGVFIGAGHNDQVLLEDPVAWLTVAGCILKPDSPNTEYLKAGDYVVTSHVSDRPENDGQGGFVVPRDPGC